MTSTFDNFGVARGNGGSFRVSGDDGAVDRGYIECTATAVSKGCRLNVDTFHSTIGDHMTLVLMAEVLDTDTNELKTINLSVLANQQVLNDTSFRGNLVIDLSYDEIDAFLQKRNPNLKLTPGVTNLSVMAFFNDASGDVQHRAGGPTRGGRFRLPDAPGAQGPVAARIHSATSDEETPLPLDMQVAFPKALTTAIPKLKDDGNIVSRLESEFKGSTDEASMNAAIHKMYGLVEKTKAGDKAAIESILGKDWTIETVNRYWLTDDGQSKAGKKGEGFFEGFLVDKNGLPLQDPMRDEYMDNSRLGLTSKEAVIRLRQNKQATVLNVKPGGGREDSKTQIKQRIEVGLELDAETSAKEAGEVIRKLATDSKWSTSVFNAADREVRKLDDQLDLAKCLDPLFKVVQDRHKFTIKNEKTSVEIEFSFDIVEVTTLRPEHADAEGNPRVVRFHVLEGELDHLQLGSTNESTFAAADASAGSFTTDESQDKWLTATGANVTMDIDPRLHELEDLENEAFRKTGSYKAFEGVNKKLINALFEKRLGPAKQKAAHAAMLLGLHPLSAESCLGYVRNAIVKAGVAFTPELRDAVAVHAADEGLREKILDLAMKNLPINDFVARLLGVSAPALNYDGDRLVKRFEEAMAPYALKMNKGVEAIIRAVSINDVTPSEINAYISRFSYQNEKVLFANLAAHSKMPAAVPDFDVRQTTAEVESALETAMIDKAIMPKLMDWFDSTVKGGATAYEIRSQLSDLRWAARSDTSEIFADLKKYTRKKVPNFSVDPQGFMKRFASPLASEFVLVDDDLRSAVAKAASKKTLKEGLELANNPGIKNLRKLFKPKTPKLKFDVTKFHTKLKASMPESVVYDDKLKAFFERGLLAQDAASELLRVVGALENHTLEKALKSYEVPGLRGLNAPTIRFDQEVYLAKFKAQAKTHFLSVDGDFEKTLKQLIDKNLYSMGEIELALTLFSSSGKKEWIEPWPDGVAPFLMSYDVKGLMKNLKANASHASDDLSYIEANLEKAIAGGLSNLISKSRDIKSLVKAVEKHSGVEAPKQD